MQVDNSSNHNFWISCNMNALDSIEFRSKTRSGLDLMEDDGVSLEFLGEFMKKFANHSIGMDLSDVNFEVTSEKSQRHADEQTFREFFELILESINRPEKRHPLISSFAYDEFIAQQKSLGSLNWAKSFKTFKKLHYFIWKIFMTTF